jgi:ribonuclease HI
VGREGEGLSSNRPELVALWECLETHPDNKNLLYLTDNETTLQTINKWIGRGVKLSLAKTADTDILRVIVIKIQQRVQAQAATLLIKVKDHRGHPLNEEADIRSEMGRRKEEQQKTWSTPTNRTIYQWSEASKTKNGMSTFKQTAWTQAVRNRMRQKVGEIQPYHTYEKGVEKWHKEHMTRKGQEGISEEGQEILEDRDIWTKRDNPPRSNPQIQKRARSNDDGVFMQHQKGPITSTFSPRGFRRSSPPFHPNFFPSKSILRGKKNCRLGQGPGPEKISRPTQCMRGA